MGADELVGRRQEHRIDTPQLVAADQLRDQVVDGIGGKAAREAGLDVTPLAVLEHRPGGGHSGRGVGQLVGEHLLSLGTSELGQAGDGGRHQRARRGRSRPTAAGRSGVAIGA